MKKVVTFTGIRPDFIRMSAIFRLLDRSFEHILVHTGQHYNEMLSDVFFEELQIRAPDYNLEVGGPGKGHHQQFAELSIKSVALLQTLQPDLVVFLGDSNSVAAAMPLKKEGYRIAHIEAGMRSGDKRMLEEINRIVCDQCSDDLFAYHADYKQHCLRENIPAERVWVVGNTIVEVCEGMKATLALGPKKRSHILMDIHRPENFRYPERLRNIFAYARQCRAQFGLPVMFLAFPRTMSYLHDAGVDLSAVEVVELMSYCQFLRMQHHALCIISDSGTAQEEPALLGTKVVVPRDATERPQSVVHGCSFMINVQEPGHPSWQRSFDFLEGPTTIDTTWLGDGKTAERVVRLLHTLL